MSTLIDRLSGGLPIRVDCDEEEAKKETGQSETQKTRLDFGGNILPRGGGRYVCPGERHPAPLICGIKADVTSTEVCICGHGENTDDSSLRLASSMSRVARQVGGGQETGYMMCRLVPITHSGIVVLPVFCFHRRIPELRAPPPIQKEKTLAPIYWPSSFVVMT
ncbi:hypothetical protein OUZ56_022522 [Daphnia magna]|uniref:Uncharacterized protein n=1 Tax=Daphnia magna TaxID=35525 RepID=A0ABR0AWS2_9CRUS|nr:hypothetical protein OUZ56_022522 [Daphnia magna]